MYGTGQGIWATDNVQQRGYQYKVNGTKQLVLS